MKKTWAIAFGFMILMFTVIAWAAPVPDTGQTKCYDVAGNVITCPSPGQALYGQDANYSLNPMSYTKLDANGNTLLGSAASWTTVKDNVTGLIWEMKTNKDGVKNYTDPHDADNTYTWYDSNPATNGGNAGTPGDGTDTEDFIKALNDAKYGGFSDWRLPTIKELAYIVNYSVPYPGPTINTDYFPNTVSSDYYWSSTTGASDTVVAWGVNFGYGFDYFYGKDYSYHVRAVRGEQSGSFDTWSNESIGDAAAEGSYTDNGDGTVTDTSTGLIWRQAGSSNTMNWEQALAYCENMDFAGYTDWRLPTIKELQSLADHSRYNPEINTIYFPNTVSSFYWSSTTRADSTYFAWFVDFSNGDHGGYNKSYSYYVRAVRGGQSGSLGNLVIFPTSRTVTKDAGTTTFSVSNTGTGTMPWTAAVTSGGTWLRITSGSSGTNAGNIVCGYDANTTAASRTGTIRVTASGATGSPMDVTVVQAAATNPIISGSVQTASGTAISGVMITFSNNGGTASTDASGNYSISVPYNYSGTATPSKTGYSFTPATITYSSLTADQSAQNYQVYLLQYTITASAGTGGTIDPSGSVSVSYGSSKTFTITPSTGYEVSSVLVDNVAITTIPKMGGTYTFYNVIENHSISARFNLKPIPTPTPRPSPTPFANIPVPETGLTKCYDADGNIITCPTPSQAFYGQDANYIINPMSYTKLDSNGNALPDSATSWTMVKDNVTGLIWEMKTNKDGVAHYDDPHDADNTYTWYDSNPATNGGDAGTPGNGTDTEDFIKALNDAKYGGFSDWRLPTIKELAYIVNYSVPYPGPTINTDYFPNTVSSFYWSSTTSAFYKGYAWGVNFFYGNDPNGYKYNARCVRAVRGGQSGLLGDLVIGSFDTWINESVGDAAAAGSYTDNGDGTVTDTSTGLIWRQAGSSNTMNWEQALAYCENMDFAGYTDWRLPTTKELRSLADYRRYIPAINATYFPNTIASFYWSSTTLANYTNCAWGVHFGNGSGLNDGKDDSGYVRAVRGGQSGSLGNLVISPTSRSVTKDAGTTTFGVSNTGTGTMPWTAAVTPASTWLSITSGSSGSNVGTINCSFTANTSTSARTATIRVTATGATGSPKDVTVTQAGTLTQTTNKILGVWSDGVYSWNQSTKKWTKIPSTDNALMIAVGKVDSDSTDDLIGVWPSGLYVRQSTGQWVKLSTSLPTWIIAGDLNNDGRDDVIGSWKGDGVYWLDSATGKWTKITTPAKQLAVGNVEGDGRDDLIGVWGDGLWVRSTKTGSWKKIDSTIPIWITAGDMTGSGRSDIIGSYTNSTWYRNSATTAWTKITTPAEQLTTGDINGDGMDDLIGIWSNAVWVRYGTTGQWQQISSSKPKWITTGRIADAVQAAGSLDDSLESGEEKDVLDLSQEGPGGLASDIVLESDGTNVKVEK